MILTVKLLFLAGLYRPFFSDLITSIYDDRIVFVKMAGLKKNITQGHTVYNVYLIKLPSSAFSS